MRALQTCYAYEAGPRSGSVRGWGLGPASVLGRGLDLAGAGFQGQGRSWFFGFCFRERYWAGAYRSEVHSMNAGFSSRVWFLSGMKLFMLRWSGGRNCGASAICGSGAARRRRCRGDWFLAGNLRLRCGDGLQSIFQHTSVRPGCLYVSSEVWTHFTPR